ncbi:DUF6503 family protein [Aquimarina litoralis]|uniref:DUF6503 family protein n=1 Tax=Aquimarina litoralis TaxID=584605 RepID=UPI001C570824|nr:DUF6503 family protein [Aquimarina litoralis]MBW1297534.1 deoxyribose-phosphate aldolase [Aquimarina litoralis]
MKKFAVLSVIVLLMSFTTISINQYSAQEIIDKAIENAGGSKFDKVGIRFTFRGKEYSSIRNNGNYQLERKIFGKEGIVHDVVNNKGLSRSIENCNIKVADSLITKISDGVNSVHYFANLPYGLNAPAVNKELVGESTIKNVSYYKVKITFNQEGGGTDFEDEFLYWIHKDNFTVDYLAYSYAVDGGGIRFREAYNSRIIKGIRFVDYNNYKTDDMSTPLSNLDKLFEKGKLKLLSKIELEDVYVYDENYVY